MLRISVRLFLLAIILAVVNCKIANAIPNDTQSWSLLTALINLDEAKRFSAYLEAQPRIGDNVSRLERLLLRPAIVYNYDQQLSLYVGYAWTPTFTTSSYDHDFNDESRTWQQILYKHDYLGLSWQHRYRQEQRYIENVDTVSHRARYLIRGSYALTGEGDFGLTGYNELFINLNDTGKARATGYDRNRFFFGPYFKSGNFRYEAGYLGEHARRFGTDQRFINAFLVSAMLTF